jgi:DNA-binding NtrC family response regulator
MYVAEAIMERREAKRPTVLLVEEEPIARLDLASELRGARYEVIEASNADEALTALHSSPIDLMISDAAMPGSIDGVALAARARKVNSGMKIIMISGESCEGQAEDVADGYFAKPYGCTPVLKTCRQLLSQRAGS